MTDQMETVMVGDKKPRKKRSPNKPKTVETNHGLVEVLVNIHALLAGLTSIPEIALDRNQATMLADSVETLMSYYDFGVSDEQQAWMNMFMTVGSVYGIKIYSYKMRIQKENESIEEDVK